MTDDVIFETPPQPPVGTYPGILTAVEVVDIDTSEGSKTLVRWTATVTGDDGNDYTIDALSSLNFGKRSKAKRWATALGHDGETLASSEVVGKAALFVLVEMEDGYVKLGDIVPAPKGSKP
jgi:hypothetical protein